MLIAQSAAHDQGGTTGDIIVQCQDLAYTFPNSKPCFRDINLMTEKDEFVAVVGPTGTGKSTLLRVIAHLIPATAGRVLLDGREVMRPTSKIALIHQSIATFPWMTALDNVKLSLRHGNFNDEEATRISEKMLDLVELRGVEEEYPKEMSGGMRQKIAIARALAASPEVLLMDEPFVHLDELTASALREEIYDLVFHPETSLKSAIMVSHNLQEVVLLADRVYVMNGTPAKMVDVVKVDLPRPRSPKDPHFFDYVDHLFNDLNLKEPKV